MAYVFAKLKLLKGILSLILSAHCLLRIILKACETILFDLSIELRSRHMLGLDKRNSCLNGIRIVFKRIPRTHNYVVDFRNFVRKDRLISRFCVSSLWLTILQIREGTDFGSAEGGCFLFRFNSGILIRSQFDGIYAS